MSIRNTEDEKRVALFDSVTGFAFGPVFEDVETADNFLAFIQSKTSARPTVLAPDWLAKFFKEFLQEQAS